MSHPRSLAALALALTVVLTGCGGTSTLTAKEFRAQATKLCNAAEKDVDKIGADLTAASSESEVTKAVDKLVARSTKLVDDIADLKEPSSLSDDVDNLLSSFRSALKKLDDATVAQLSTMEDPFANANDKAKKLGIDACGD